VTLNLIRNAIEAMADASGAKLTISTSLEGGKYVVVTISDTGPGLAPEVIEKLFTPCATTKAEGMGIGLAICGSIMESHDGLISATSGKGGSKFSFGLPISREPLRAAGNQEAMQSAHC